MDILGFRSTLGFKLSQIGSVVTDPLEPPTGENQVNTAGGSIREGEVFNVYRASGELTNISDITINNVAATGVTSIDDNNVQATAPTTGLMYGTYSMRLV